MRLGRELVLLMAGLILLVTVSFQASAGTSGYCLECHSSKFLEAIGRDLSRSSDDRGVYSAKLDPCPGLRSLSEEMFFTEGRIAKLDEILQAMEKDGWKTDSLRSRVSESAESLLDLKRREKISVRQVSREASAIRTVLQKTYEHTLQSRGESSRRWLIGLGGLFLLGLLVLIGLGYRKLGRMGKALSVYLLIGGMVSLTATACAPSGPPNKRATQARLEEALSVAAQSTGQMEETFYQSCLLAEMSRAWAQIEPAASERGFQLAWQMSLEAREKAGQIKALKEIASRWLDRASASKEGVRFDSVLDLRDEMQNAQGRTWALRAVAEEWIQVNPKGGRSALEYATREALAVEGLELRDRDLSSMGAAWAGIDENRSIEIARTIRDPFLKAVALTEVALSGNDRGRAGDLLKEAWKAAEAIPPSYSQLRAMTRIAVTAARLFPQEKSGWIDRTLLHVQKLEPDRLRAFALQDVVLHWAPLDFEQAKRLAMEIPSVYPEERAYALIYLAKSGRVSRQKALTLLREASAEIVRISDPLEAQKVKGRIGEEMAELDPGEALKILPQIEASNYRSEILALLALKLSHESKRKALDLAERISAEPFHTDADVAVVSQWIDREKEKVASLYQEAFQAGAAISDPYAKALFLIELGKSWNRIERGKGLKLLEPVLASAEKVSSPLLRIEIIEAIAEALKKDDPAKSQLLLNGIEPSLLRIRKSFAEVQKWAPVDAQKAKELVEAFPSDFPFEKAMALREAAAGSRKIAPRLAWEFYEKAIDQIVTLPKGDKGRKALSSLAGEAVRLDKERTLEKIRRIDQSETRDLLLKEAGIVWAEEDPLFAMKMAREVTEGPLRLMLYQRIADHAAKRLAGLKKTGPGQPGLLALGYWGSGREKAKSDELQAIPYYEKALREIERVDDSRTRSFLLSGLASGWAPVDEERALRVARRIPADHAEPLSHTLLQIGTELSKWNRKGAEIVFQKTVLAAAKIQEPRLRAKRLLEIGRQWQGINPDKGKEILALAEKEARKRLSPEDSDLLLTEILVARSADGPDPSGIFQNTDGPLIRARVLFDRGRTESKRTIEESMEVLEKALSYAQKAKHHRLMAEVALLWYALDPGRGLDICSQISDDEIRVRTICKMAQKAVGGKGGESKLLLERAVQESLRVRGSTEKIKLLKEIAGILVPIDKEQAKSVYQIAYQVMKRSAL